MKAAVALVVALGLSAMPVAGQGIDPFYVDLERSARAALARGDAREAARRFRTACFGMLDEPLRLGACLIRLGIAEGRAGDREGFEETYRRMAAVEDRFQAFSRATVEAEERAELLARAAEILTADQLAVAPGIAAEVSRSRMQASVAEAEEAPDDDAGPSRSGGFDRRTNKSEVPGEAPAAVVPPSADTETAIGQPALETPPAESVRTEPQIEPPADPEPRLDESDRATLDEASTVLAGATRLEALRGALERVRTIADRLPAVPVAERLVANLAYRASDWATCADYYRRGGAPDPSEALQRFYMAVCLHETGDSATAAELLRPVAPALHRTPFVDAYLARILGDSGGAPP